MKKIIPLLLKTTISCQTFIRPWRLCSNLIEIVNISPGRNIDQNIFWWQDPPPSDSNSGHASAFSLIPYINAP